MTCALLAGSVAASSARVDDLGARAAAKPHTAKKKCKGKRVVVKLAGKTRCVPLKSALPKPNPIDRRVAIVGEGLTPAIAHVPDPKNEVPPPMETVYRKLAPQAQKGMEKAVGIAIGKLDALGAARAARLSRASASSRARASQESGNSFSTTIGGVQIDGRLTIAIEASGELMGTAQLSETRDQGGGKTVKVTTEVPIRLKHQGFEAPECPTADGKVKGRDTVGITVRTEVRSNGGKDLDEYYIFEVADDTDPLNGTVADDAKMDELEIKSIEEITEKAGGSIFGGSVVNASIVRNTVYDMRTGAYDPHVTLVNVGVVLSGVLRIFTPFVRPQVSARLKASADKGFAATVDYEVKKFRELEAGWNTPNRCAKLNFDRAKESLTLKRGQSGDENVRIDAKAGGSPAKGDWTVSGQENGAFTLSSHSVNPTSFHYTVTDVGKGAKLKGAFRATSKAGVAEDSWVQKTEDLTINQIEGTFGGEMSQETALMVPSTQKWSGVAKFTRFGPSGKGGASGIYLLSSGNVSIDLSGVEQSGITGCLQSGSAQKALVGGSMTVTGTGPEGGAPYDYDISLTMPFGSVKATRHDCPQAAKKEGFEGTEFDAVPAWQLDVEGEESADGETYVGSKEESFGSPPFITALEQDWTLHGKP